MTTRRAFAAGTVAAAGLCLGGGRLLAAAEAGGARPRVRPLPSDGRTPIPLLGLGCAERFPLRARAGEAEGALAARMVEEALARGVTWLDTGYAYHKGLSEPFLGRVLKRHPREAFLLSTKMPTWLVKTADDAKRIFEEQRARCQVDFFDFYLLHSISKKAEFERVYVKLGVLDYLLEQKRRGRIRHLGLSYHGKSAYLGELLDAYPGTFEVCMMMLNAMEFTWNPDARHLAETAATRGVAVLVMEPLAGGRAAALRGEAREILRAARPDDSPARWGLRFAASQPGVACVFSGMGKIEYLRENVETLSETFRPLDAAERAAYAAAIAAYMKHPSIPCTGCSYCVPCPYGVRIPEIFAWYNEWAQNGRLPTDEGAHATQALRRRFLASYYNTFRPRERADRCLVCRKCLVPCPQWTFRIPTEMEKVAACVARVEAAYVQKGGAVR